MLVDRLEQEAVIRPVQGYRRAALAALEQPLPGRECQAATGLLAAVTANAVGLEDRSDLRLEELYSLGRRWWLCAGGQEDRPSE